MEATDKLDGPLLVLTRGLPGSGKTTWARSQPGLIRVNRDDLRRMLHGGRTGAPSDEVQVTQVQHAAVTALLGKGAAVVCDDTNLRNRTARELATIAASQGVPVVIRDFTDVPVAECIRRDAARDPAEQVGEAVIRRMHERYLAGQKLPLPTPVPPQSSAGIATTYVPPAEGPEVVLVDIDGTVALMNGRSPYDATRVGEDLPNLAVIAAVRAMSAAGYQIVYCSGRTDDCRSATEVWLSEHVGVPYAGLHMRATGDQRRDSIVKLEIFDREIRSRYRVVGVFDDRAQVVRAWRSIGLTVFQVAEGDF